MAETQSLQSNSQIHLPADQEPKNLRLGEPLSDFKALQPVKIRLIDKPRIEFVTKVYNRKSVTVVTVSRPQKSFVLLPSPRFRRLRLALLSLWVAFAHWYGIRLDRVHTTQTPQL